MERLIRAILECPTNGVREIVERTDDPTVERLFEDDLPHRGVLGRDRRSRHAQIIKNALESTSESTCHCGEFTSRHDDGQPRPFADTDEQPLRSGEQRLEVPIAQRCRRSC